MNCDKFLDLISARLDGELTAQEEASLTAHLQECPVCRAIADDMKTLHSACSSLEEVDAPAELSQTVMRKIKAERSTARHRVIRRISGLAACLVGEGGSHGGPADALDTLDHQGGGGQQRTGGAGGDKGVSLLLQKAKTHGHGTVSLRPNHRNGIVLHIDHAACVNYIKAAQVHMLRLGYFFNSRLVTYENEAGVIFKGCKIRALYNFKRGFVAAHTINNYSHIFP